MQFEHQKPTLRPCFFLYLKKLQLFLIFLTLFSSLASAKPTVFYPVTEFGAVGDGKSINTQAIQKAIDSAAKAGGGTVIFPAGKFLTGTIYLRDHITLELEAGAILLGSTRVMDYPIHFTNYPSWADQYSVRTLILAEGVENIAITGRGTIHGQGEAFLDFIASDAEVAAITRQMPDSSRYKIKAQYANRPSIIWFINCRDVLVEGVTLQNSAMWLQHYVHCRHLTLQNLRVINHCNRNNDMMDIDSCQDVLVTGCYGDTIDDAVTLKSNGPDPLENVTISNCILRSHVNAIKTGTESIGSFKNIAITNCVIVRSEFPEVIPGSPDPEGYAGISLSGVDGASVECVTISNISIQGFTTPIFFRRGSRMRRFRPGAPALPVGVFRDVSVNNLVASNVGNVCSAISGIPGHPLERISFSNITIQCRGGIQEDRSRLEVPELEGAYPGSGMFGDLPAYGFYCRHVKDLTFQNVRVGFNTPDWRYGLVFDQIENLTLNTLSAQISPQTPAAVLFKDVENALVTGCNPPKMPVFIRLQGKNISIAQTGNNFERVAQPISAID